MPLTNRQFELITREYDEKRSRHRRILEDRLSLIRKNIPEYEEIEDSISSVSVDGFLSLINRPDEGTTPDSIRRKLSALRESKILLLTKNGYPPDYLEPTYDCPLCKDTGFIEREKCLCFKKRVTTLLYAQSNLGGTLDDENFSHLSYEYYQGEDLLAFQKAVDSARNFINKFPSGLNLLFYGKVGSGKTFLSKCITKELIDKGFSVLYFSSGSLTDFFFNKYSGPEGITTDDIYTCDLLIIDDLGTEAPNNTVISKFYGLLDSRLSNKRSTIISTNLDLTSLRDIYSERVLSRIAYSYEILNINCPDIRIQKRKKS